jgi:hypothetical protein
MGIGSSYPVNVPAVVVLLIARRRPGRPASTMRIPMARRANDRLADLQSINAPIASHGHGKPIADAVGLAGELLAALDAVISSELANGYPSNRLPILDDTIARTQRTFPAILDAIARQLADKGIGLADSTAYRDGLGAAYAASLAFWRVYRGTSTDGAAPRTKPTDRAAYRDWYISIAGEHEAAVRSAHNHAANDVIPRLRAILATQSKGGKVAKSPTREARRGRPTSEEKAADVKLIAALNKHHGYHETVRDYELSRSPLTGAELGRLGGVSRETARKFIENRLEGRTNYAAKCESPQGIYTLLVGLNGHLSDQKLRSMVAEQMPSASG